MERKRVGLIASLITAGAFALEACGAPVPPTPNPTRTPEATPSATPSLMVTPSPEVTPSPTIVVTPSPSPEVTPSPTIVVTPTPSPEVTPSPTVIPTPTEKPTPETTPTPIITLVDQIITEANDNGWPQVTEQEVIDSINNAYDNDPEAAAIVNPIANTLEKDFINNVLWSNCVNDDRENVRAQDCAFTVAHIYWEGYVIKQNPLWMDSVSKVISYAKKTFDSHYFNQFIDLVKPLTTPPF